MSTDKCSGSKQIQKLKGRAYTQNSLGEQRVSRKRIDDPNSGRGHEIESKVSLRITNKVIITYDDSTDEEEYLKKMFKIRGKQLTVLRSQFN